MATLPESEIGALLEVHNEWKLDSGKLVRDWSFRDFVEAMGFVNSIAALAKQAGHHPDIDIRYSRVRLALISHDAGGITGRDARMAKRISREFPPS